MTWNVVKFLKEDLVEAVPSSWYVASSSECFWPPMGTKTTKVLKYIEESHQPDSNWKAHPAKLLGIYATYQEAQRKAKKAMFTSDISSANDELHFRNKRKRKQNPRYAQSDSENDEIVATSSEDEVFPVLRKNIFNSSWTTSVSQRKRRSRSLSPRLASVDENNKKGETVRRSRSLSFVETSVEAVNDEKADEPNLIDKAEQTKEHKEPTKGKKGDDNSDSEFKRLVLKELSTLSLQVSGLQDSVVQLLNIQKINSLAGSLNTTATSLAETKKLNDSLPVPTLQDMELLEEWLEENDHYNITVSEFRRIGGQSATQHTRKILYKTFSNEVAMLFSWDGHKQKRPLKGYKLARCIVDAVKIQYPHALENDIIGVIKIFLVKAKERAALKKQKS